jgi:beta-lactamase superfamily II metal-dependent hydrolase
VVIDGGFQENGTQLAQLIQQRYQTRQIDLMISTHPDQDHIAGLSEIVNNMDVRRVWVHDPSNHTTSYNKIRVGLSIQKAMQVSNRIAKSLDDLQSLLRIVDGRRIPREEPFSGMQYGPLTILGPSIELYEQKLAELAADSSFTKAELMEKDDDISELQEAIMLAKGTDSALDENNETSPLNETSTIIYGSMVRETCVWTGDAGVLSFEDTRRRWNYGGISWLHVPHHGSKKNLSSDIVAYLRPSVSYISAAGTKEHPSRAAINALKKFGDVYSTHKGNGLWHHNGASISSRSDFVKADPL